MRITGLVPPIALVLAACATPPDASSPPAAPDPVVAEGLMLARVHCADCHAIDTGVASRSPQAPALSRLYQHYDVDHIEKALAAGIVVGHPEMPEFRFHPEDAHALAKYLASVQGK